MSPSNWHKTLLNGYETPASQVVVMIVIMGLWLVSPSHSFALEPLIHGGQERERFIMSDNGVPKRGLTIEIIDELTQRLELPVVHRTCPFKRCINQLISGQVDLMMFITINPRRADAAEFVQVWPNPLNIHFYARGREAPLLQNLDDLMKLRVGYVKGFFYSQQLETIPLEQHTEVIKEVQLPRMLLAGRIDAFPVYGDSHEFIDRDYPQLQLAPLKLPGPAFAILSISKMSPYIGYAEQMNQTLVDMAIDGTLDSIWGRYHEGEKIGMPPALRHQVEQAQNETAND